MEGTYSKKWLHSKAPPTTRSAETWLYSIYTDYIHVQAHSQTSILSLEKRCGIIGGDVWMWGSIHCKMKHLRLVAVHKGVLSLSFFSSPLSSPLLSTPLTFLISFLSKFCLFLCHISLVEVVGTIEDVDLRVAKPIFSGNIFTQKRYNMPTLRSSSFVTRLCYEEE